MECESWAIVQWQQHFTLISSNIRSGVRTMKQQICNFISLQATASETINSSCLQRNMSWYWKSHRHRQLWQTWWMWVQDAENCKLQLHSDTVRVHTLTVISWLQFYWWYPGSVVECQQKITVNIITDRYLPTLHSSVSVAFWGIFKIILVIASNQPQISSVGKYETLCSWSNYF